MFVYNCYSCKHVSVYKTKKQIAPDICIQLLISVYRTSNAQSYKN